MESLSAWGKVFQTRGKSESADFPPGCQTFLRAHGTFLRCQIRVQLGLETEIGFQQILRMIPHHPTENSKTEEMYVERSRLLNESNPKYTMGRLTIERGERIIQRNTTVKS